MSIQRELAAARTELAQLEARAQQVRERLAHLEAAASHSHRSLPIVADVSSVHEGRLAMTSAEKVAVFRTLFRGRDDVFPKWWTNARTNRSGYAPACEHEWIKHVCEKPRVRCSDCLHQRFTAVTDQIIVDHLRGRSTLGVYPLLMDDTCWFLAADFDGETWREDVGALRDSCQRHGIAISIERSRSGDGAHAWWFFDRPIPARLARQFGCALLTDAMRHRRHLPMRSYDRLFPNQDTMPKGGFGNLIALPLQGEARQRGNTVFLNEAGEPVPDQWSYLRTVDRLDRDRIEALVADATREGRLLAVGTRWASDPEEARDHGRRISRRAVAHADARASSQTSISVPSVPVVRARLAQRLSIPAAGLPSAILRDIAQVAAFQNPEYYKRQRLRLYTGATPRVIDCAEQLTEQVTVPRGCLDDVTAVLAAYNTALQIDDHREQGVLPPPASSLEFHGALRPEQQAAVDALLPHDIGILVAPPGTGKTVMGAAVIAARHTATLVLVHSRPLAEQWVAQLTAFLGIEPGLYGAGKRRRTGIVDVATLPAIAPGGQIKPWVTEYGQVVVDECHHAPAFSVERVLSAIPARYLVGLTATPRRRDGLHPILHMQLGPIRHTIAATAAVTQQHLHPTLVLRDTAFTVPTDMFEQPSIQALYRLLAEDERRNDLIFHDVLAALEEGRSPLVLTERTDHLEYLAARFGKFTKHLVVLRGSVSQRQRRQAHEQLAAVPADDERLIVATSRYIGEGFDAPRLDTLFLTMPISWKGRLVQYAGRLHRAHTGKREVRIYDYVDGHVPLLAKMFERRTTGYRTMGYTA